MSKAEDSFGEYVRARLHSLSRAAFLLCGDSHTAEDLVQQTLINVASRWERIISGGDPEPYVRRTLYHLHISWWRNRRRDPVPTAETPEPAEPIAPDRFDAVADSIALRRALARLAPKQRAVLVLRYYEDLTEAQTAEVLGCSVNTVKSQARDGLARLRSFAAGTVEVAS